MPEFIRYIEPPGDCQHLGRIQKEETFSLHADMERHVCETCGKRLFEVVWFERDDCSSQYTWLDKVWQERPYVERQKQMVTNNEN